MNRFRRHPSSLGRFELFAGLTAGQLDRVESLLTEVRLEPGQILMREGAPGLEFVLISAGTAEVSVGAGPNRRVVATLGPGDFVGEMSLLSQVPRSATVTATSPLTILVANLAEFASLLDLPAIEARLNLAAVSRREANVEAGLAA